MISALFSTVAFSFVLQTDLDIVYENGQHPKIDEEKYT